MKAALSVIASNEVDKIAQQVRKGEGRKEREITFNDRFSPFSQVDWQALAFNGLLRQEIKHD